MNARHNQPTRGASAAHALVGRIFVAAPLGDDVRRSLVDHLELSLGGRPLPGRVVRPESWHLTLRFLGDTERGVYDRMMTNLRSAPLGAPFDLVFTSLGAFPRPDHARVLWLGTGAGADALTSLAGVVERCAVDAGLPPETRPFAAHLTLSRLRPEEDLRRLLAAVPVFDVAQHVNEVVIYRSHLERSGARYEALERLSLGQLASRGTGPAGADTGGS